MNHRVERQLAEWASDKPPFLVMLTLGAVTGAGIAQELLQLVSERHKFTTKFAKPEPPTWLPFYKGHRVWSDEICRLLGLVDGDGEPLTRMLDMMRLATRQAVADPDAFKAELQQMPPDELKATFMEGHEMWQSLAKGSIMEAAGSDDQWIDDAAVGVASQSQAFGFLLRVWFPCWILHKQHPSQLYRAARLGDDDAMESLLRLDKTLLLDPAIARQVFDSAYAKGRGRFRRFADAIKGQPRGKMTSAKIKKRTAALVAQWSEECGFPISVAEIRRVFDILAGHDGKLADNELPAAPESFAKAVQREKTWQPIRLDKS